MKSSHATVVDVETSRTNLERIGFEEYSLASMSRMIEGRYGYRVVVRLEDMSWPEGLDLYSDEAEDIPPMWTPLERATFEVQLPHQCDSWQILNSEVNVAAAHELMRVFTDETREAGRWLVRATGAVTYKEQQA